MKPSPLELALQQLVGVKGAVMDKDLQRLASKGQAAPQGDSPDTQTADGESLSDEELARRLQQYGC